MMGRLVVFLGALAVVTAACAGQLVSQKSRTEALARYQHDLVSVLTLRADAPHLLGAALLARNFDDSGPGLDYSSLLKRATRADPDSAAIAWAALSDCDAKAAGCPNADALMRLQQLAPDNAAVWIMRLDVAARDRDHGAERQALEMAAKAKIYNNYGGELLRALTLAATALPVPDSALRAYAGSADSKAGPASAQVFLAYGQADATAVPNFFPLMALCDPDGGQETAENRSDCLQLARVLAWGSSPRARAAGLHLQDILATDDAAREAARADMRDLSWQLRNYSHLVLKALRDQTLAVQLLRLGQSGGSELSRMSALLQHEGIPARAPEQPDAATAGSTSLSSAPADPTPAPASTASVSPVTANSISAAAMSIPAPAASTALAPSATSSTPAPANASSVAPAMATSAAAGSPQSGQ